MAQKYFDLGMKGEEVKRRLELLNGVDNVLSESDLKEILSYIDSGEITIDNINDYINKTKG